MSVHVTQHAIDRYVERIAPVDREVARRTIAAAAPAIETAAAFGAHTVRLGNGAKLVIRGPSAGLGTGSSRIAVTTVLARNVINWDDVPRSRSVTPICCGSCGLRCGHPLARVCTRTDCGLGHLGHNERSQS